MPKLQLSTGIEMYYEVQGSGPPLLLIMGTAADHTTWDNQVAAYRDEYTVITYDARGTGQSTQPELAESYSMKVLADDAAALLGSIGIKRAHVSGLSLGSATAQELVINYPHLVESLQLHCTWGHSDEWFCRMIDSMEVPVRVGDLAMYIRLALLWVSSPSFVNETPERARDFERAFLLENPHPPSPHGILGHFHADKTHDTLSRLNGIRVPTLITSGEMDWQVPARYGRAVYERIATAQWHCFAGPFSSHIAFHEMPDEWNDVTLNWLRGVSS